MLVKVVWLQHFLGPLAVEPVFSPSALTGSLEAIPYGGIHPKYRGGGLGLAQLKLFRNNVKNICGSSLNPYPSLNP